MRIISAMMFFVLLSSPCFAFNIETQNICETSGFIVELTDTTLSVKNQSGNDAFKVYVLLYVEDAESSSFEWDYSKQSREYYTHVLPDGFTFKIKNLDINKGVSSYKYKARVYFTDEYK